MTEHTNAFEASDVPMSEIDEQTLDPLVEAQITEFNNRIQALRALNLVETAAMIERRRDKLLQKVRDPLEG